MNISDDLRDILERMMEDEIMNFYLNPPEWVGYFDRPANQLEYEQVASTVAEYHRRLARLAEEVGLIFEDVVRRSVEMEYIKEMDKLLRSARGNQ